MADVIIGKTDNGAKLPVNVDTRGRLVISGTVSSIGNVETILNTQTAIETAMAADLALTKSSAASIAGMAIPANDYMEFGYTGSNLTSVIYKSGGSGGTTVATLTSAYSGSNLTSVTKS
jgi:hypothetical protein